MYFLNFASFTNGQPKSTLKGHANKCKLLFFSSLRSLRAETSCISRKTETSYIPTKNVYVSLRKNPPFSLNFTKNLRSRLYSLRMSRETDLDLRKLKITLVTNYDISHPQCPSLSTHVL